jgi:hypothetical protein
VPDQVWNDIAMDFIDLGSISVVARVLFFRYDMGEVQ